MGGPWPTLGLLVSVVWAAYLIDRSVVWKWQPDHSVARCAVNFGLNGLRNVFRFALDWRQITPLLHTVEVGV